MFLNNLKYIKINSIKEKTWKQSIRIIKKIMIKSHVWYVNLMLRYEICILHVS